MRLVSEESVSGSLAAKPGVPVKGDIALAFQVLESFPEEVHLVADGRDLDHSGVIQGPDKSMAVGLHGIGVSVLWKCGKVFPAEFVVEEGLAGLEYLPAHFPHVLDRLVDVCPRKLMRGINDDVAPALDNAFFDGHRDTLGYQEAEQVHVLQALPAELRKQRRVYHLVLGVQPEKELVGHVRVGTLDQVHVRGGVHGLQHQVFEHADGILRRASHAG